MAGLMDKEKVLEQWKACKNVFDPLYEQCESDWLFLHGRNQWDDKVKQKRERQGRPCLVLNQLQPYVKQIVNEIRQSRLAIRVSPVDSQADVGTAEVLQGVIRNIERQSDAQTAYATAVMNAVGAGIGWIVIDVDYVDNDSFDQEPRIRRVLDFQSVYIDPASKELDGSDAEFAFVATEYTKEQFEKDYPDAEPVSFDTASNEDCVVVVEHYYKCYEKDTLYQIVLVDGSIQVINEEQKAVIDEDGTVVYELMSERKVDIPYVKHCVYGGQEEPLSESDFPCDFIPVVPVIGEEVYIDGEREFQSIIRHTKDPQRMFNYWKSAGTEFIALQPKAPWIGAKGSFKSYASKWAHANAENFSTLEYDLVYDENGQRAEPPQRQMPVQGSPAMMQEALSAKEDIRLAIGMPLANMGESSNEISGIAVRNRQLYGDNATFHFIDNLSTSIRQVGKILVNMIPRLYSERKIARVLGEDNQPENIPVNQPFVVENGQKRPVRRNEAAQGIYDLSVGKYDVVCDVGASYSSKRQEMADKLSELIQGRPELGAIAGDLLIEALDLPMSKEIAERIRATMDPSILGDDPQAEALKKAAQTVEQLQQQLMDYQAALESKEKDKEFEQSVELKRLEQDRIKLQIEAEKTQSEIQKTMAEIEKMKAETKEINIDAIAALGNAVNGIAAQVQDMGGAIEIMLDAKEIEDSEGTSSPKEEDEQLEDSDND